MPVGLDREIWLGRDVPVAMSIRWSSIRPETQEERFRSALKTQP
jgi:hypothetical protein